MDEKLTRKSQETELRPDAWSRFERAVDVVAKSPPQHRTKDNKRSAAGAIKSKKVRITKTGG